MLDLKLGDIIKFYRKDKWWEGRITLIIPESKKFEKSYMIQFGVRNSQGKLDFYSSNLNLFESDLVSSKVEKLEK